MAERAAALTISSSRAGGDGGEDLSGPALVGFLERELGLEAAVVEVLPDDRELIARRLRELCDSGDVRLILTSGGTGFAPSDQTPEATRDVVEREAPGLAEAIRSASREHTPHWMLSRATAGIRDSTLIVNFPGSPRSIGEAGMALAEALPHALRLLSDERDPHD